MSRPRPSVAVPTDSISFRRIVAEAPTWLAPGGGLAIEIQYDQAERVQACFVEAGFTDVRLDRDADDLDRVVSGRLAGG